MNNIGTEMMMVFRLTNLETKLLKTLTIIYGNVYRQNNWRRTNVATMKCPFIHIDVCQRYGSQRDRRVRIADPAAGACSGVRYSRVGRCSHWCTFRCRSPAVTDGEGFACSTTEETIEKQAAEKLWKTAVPVLW